MTILLDSNQKSHDERTDNATLYRILRQGIPVIDQPLDSADISFETDDGELPVFWGGELKKYPEDLISSLSDGRLMRQLPSMCHGYTHPYLIIVGGPMKVNPVTGKVLTRKKNKLRKNSKSVTYTWFDSPYSFGFVSNTLLKFERSGGMVREFETLEDAAMFVVNSYTYWKRDNHNDLTFPFIREPRTPQWKLVDNITAALYLRVKDSNTRRGVSPKQALELAEKFPRVIDLINANDKDILKALGVSGSKSKVLDLLRESLG